MEKIEVIYNNKRYFYRDSHFYDNNGIRVCKVLEDEIYKTLPSMKKELTKTNYNDKSFFNLIKYNQPVKEKINYIFIYNSKEHTIEGTISKKIIDVFKRNCDILDYKDYVLFLNTFVKYFKKYIINMEDYLITVVPNHKAEKNNGGNISRIAKDIALRCGCEIDTNILLRNKTIKSHMEEGKIRTVEEHYNSIIIDDVNKVKNKKIILIDDVTVTGTTLLACKNILLKANASEVISFAFAKSGGCNY